MNQTYSIMEARQNLTKFPDDFEKHPEKGAVTVTRRGKPVLAVLSWDLYESIQETLEVLSDPEMMAALKESLQDLKKGKFVSWNKAKKELSL